MNISPAAYAALTGRIDQLTEQVATLFVMLAKREHRNPTIDAFCRRHGISRRTYERMRAAGTGPRETATGKNRITITEQDESVWVQARQAAVITEATNRGIRSRAAAAKVEAPSV